MKTEDIPGWGLRIFVFVAIIAALSLGLIGWSLDIARIDGIAVAISGLLLHLGLYLVTVSFLPSFFAPRFMIFGSGFTSVGLFFSFLFGSEFTITSFPVNLVWQHPFATLVGWLAVPIGVAAYAMIASRVVRRSREGVPTGIMGVLNQATQRMELFLVVVSMISMLVWFVTREESTGMLSFSVRVLMRACTFVPLTVGYYWDRFRIALFFWITTFVIGLYFAFLTGSRGYVFLPLMLFFIGVMMRQLAKRRIMTSLVILGPMMVLLVLFGGMIGLVRDELGRVNVGAQGDASFSERANLAQQVMHGGSEGVGNENPVANIAFRLVPWANLAVPVMSPQEVPYRGFGDLWPEVKSAFYIARFTGIVYISGEFSNDYGFYTGESSSVEFGVIADAWSRGGFLAAVIFGAIGAWLLVLLENALDVLAGRQIEWRIFVVLMVFSVAWFDFGRAGLIYSFRGAVISALILTAPIVIDRILTARHV